MSNIDGSSVPPAITGILMGRTTDGGTPSNLAPVLEAFAKFLDHGVAKGGRDRQQCRDILRLFQPRPGIVAAADGGDYKAGELTEQYGAAFEKLEEFCETQRTRYWWDLSDAVGALRVVRAACPRIRRAIVEGGASTPAELQVLARNRDAVAEEDLPGLECIMRRRHPLARELHTAYVLHAEVVNAVADKVLAEKQRARRDPTVLDILRSW
ncbi:hypothetical protein DL766_009134 [Monosporascus sp. MC13-8B]|uniref:Uncharacterized protein n=1 Tax=Monosporascus cannonballus TaxID=155416 RepID=A0ABY0HGE3_9PEZI|nr:hypothetical protein DL762_001379 [Monosporascus cannonballus]RYP01008.1 hypothetical protein DL763_000429 [Monosporascus cannonballus]RYP16418.1 hypothetical protein DL766_009134 [Monosporascus sp. MC13-8B]